ncbi:MAG: hypothetical protein ACOYN6_03285 [Ignavibacteria bacterium]
MRTQSKLFVTAFLLFCFLAPLLKSQTCDDNLVFQIEKIKQEIETSLVSATTTEAKLESGERLLAFYKDGSLIKISVDLYDYDGPQFSTELFFRDGFVKLVVEEYIKSRKICKDCYYFADDKLVCYKDVKSDEYKPSDKYAKAEKKWLKKVEKYLEAIQ